MTAFVETFSNFMNQIATVVQSFFVGIVQMLANIPRAVHFFNEFSQVLPAEILVYALAFVTISVLYLIIGR